MPTFHFETTVALPLERVWAMFEDIETILPALTPPEQEMELISASPLPPRVGTEVRLSAKTPIGRKTWLARYIEYVPPHDTPKGRAAWFVDQQVEGPFTAWTHAHRLEAIDATSTRLIDHIDYTPPGGLAGRMAATMLVTPQLNKLFAYRSKALQERAAAMK
ncbi:MAG TPA: SRPBCC family protein [Tepidisphaeraceae bacterium]